MNYKSFNLRDWISHISGVIEDESELDGNEMRDLVKFLSGLPKWIPVSARLPESEGYGHYFLCCLENGIIRILGYSNILTTCCPKGFYYEEENGTTWRQDINPVIAWMPLPAPFDPQESEVSK